MKKVWIGLGILLLIAAGVLAALCLLLRLLLPRGRGLEFYVPRVGKDFYVPRARKESYLLGGGRNVWGPIANRTGKQ